MRKLYEKSEILFAVLWILAYCFVMAPIKGNSSGKAFGCCFRC